MARVRKNPTVHFGPARNHARGGNAIKAMRGHTHTAGSPGASGVKVRDTPGSGGKGG